MSQALALNNADAKNPTHAQTQAVLAMRRFQKSNPTLDSNNPDHINAYIALKSGVARVSGAQIEAYLASAKSSLHHGASNTLTMWAVPKGNWPNGLPPNLLEHAKSASDFTDMALVDGGELDMVNYYIIDEVVPRTDLGQMVRTLTFFQVVRTKVRAVRPQPVSTLPALEDAHPSQPQAAPPAPHAGVLPQPQADSSVQTDVVDI